MKDNNKKAPYVDMVLIVGLVLYMIYAVVNHRFWEVPDILAYPWMIISCGFMIVGVYRTGRKLGEHLKK